MSDKEEHHSDSDSDMAECLNGLSSESSGSQSANILIFKYLAKINPILTRQNFFFRSQQK